MRKITIFTPTYNRSYILDNLYNSLCIQTCFDFEWIIVDDGSIDDTKEKVSFWIENEKRFEIKYFFKMNGGKQTAINYGVRKSELKWFFIVDSDDSLLENAIEKFLAWEKSLPNTNKFAAISGTRITPNGDIIGKNPLGSYIDSTHLERKANGIYGDKAEVYYTEILKKYPFPEFNGEKYCGEDIVWNRIAYDGFKIRYYNSPLVFCEYQPDGITKNWDEILNKGPQWNALYIKDIIVFRNYSNKNKIGAYYQYWKRYKKIGNKKICEYLNISCFMLFLSIIISRIYYFSNKNI